jgi:hypothetical protein
MPEETAPSVCCDFCKSTLVPMVPKVKKTKFLTRYGKHHKIVDRNSRLPSKTRFEVGSKQKLNTNFTTEVFSSLKEEL